MNAMLPIMPGIQDVPLVKEQKTDVTGDAKAESPFVSMLAGLSVLSPETAAAATAADQAGTPESTLVSSLARDGSKDKKGAGTTDSLGLILAMAAAGNNGALATAAPQYTEAGKSAAGMKADQTAAMQAAPALSVVGTAALQEMVSEPKAGGKTAGDSVEKEMQVSGNAAEAGKSAAGMKADQTAAMQAAPATSVGGAAALQEMVSEPKAGGGIAGDSVAKQLQVPESAVEAGKPVSGMKPDQTAAAQTVPVTSVGGAAVLRVVSSESKAGENNAGVSAMEQMQVPGTGSPEESPALDEKMAPSKAVHPSRSAASSTQGKGAALFAGNADTAVSQPMKEANSQDASSVVHPMSGKSAEGTASVRHASANGYTAEIPVSGSGTAADAKSVKQFSEETAAAVKLTDGIAAERKIVGEVQPPAGEVKNIRTVHETPAVPDNSAAGVDAAVRHDTPQRVHEAVEAPHTIKVQDQMFQVTRINAGRLEVTVHPEGLGKLDIEVNLSSGQIHARISASDTQVRDMLQRNLPDIMNALAAEGHTVGGLSIGLRDGREHPQQGPSEQPRAEVQKVAAADILPVRPVNNSIVSIFV